MPLRDASPASRAARRQLSGDPPASADMTFGGRKFFVGGLPHSADDAALAEHFQRFGRVASAVVMRSRRTNAANGEVTMRSRGFGFVTFVDAEAARECAAAAQHMIRDKVVDVKSATPTAAS